MSIKAVIGQTVTDGNKYKGGETNTIIITIDERTKTIFGDIKERFINTLQPKIVHVNIAVNPEQSIPQEQIKTLTDDDANNVIFNDRIYYLFSKSDDILIYNNYGEDEIFRFLAVNTTQAKYHYSQYKIWNSEDIQQEVDRLDARIDEEILRATTAEETIQALIGNFDDHTDNTVLGYFNNNAIGTIEFSHNPSTGKMHYLWKDILGEVDYENDLQLNTDEIIIAADLDYENKKIIYTLAGTEETESGEEIHKTIECDISEMIDDYEARAVNSFTWSQNKNTGVVTLNLFNFNGNQIDSKTLNLDTEYIIRDIDLDYTHKKLVCTLNDNDGKAASTFDVNLSDMIDDYNQRLEDIWTEIGEYGDSSSEHTIYGHLKAEEERAITAEEVLQDNIDAEEERAEVAEQQLQENIELEEQRANLAEETLQENLDTETERAIVAEEVLDGKIDDEIDRAESEETRIENKLDTRIDEEIQARINDVDAEESRATQAEETLQENLDEEASTRESADIALQENIDTETERAITSETILDDKIDTETTRAEGAESNLNTKINTEIIDRQNADATLQTNINNEANARTDADNTLQSNIDTEELRATTQEGTLQDNIDAEEQARIAAINALDLAQVGSDGNYIKFVSQEDGQVAAQKQAFDTTIDTNSNDTNAPTSKAVKDHVQAEINKLDVASQGGNGKYIRSILEEDGKISATPQDFDTDFTNPSNNNAPTTKAVKDYVDDGDNDLSTALQAHTSDTNNPHQVTKTQVGLGDVANTGDSDTPLENGTTKFTTGGAYNLKQSLEGEITTLETTTNNKINVNVHIEGNQDEITYNGDTVTKTSPYKNLNTGVTGSRSEVIHLANNTTAGLMSYSDYNQIRNNTSRIENLEGQTTRLLYTDSQNPTQQNIQDFVDDYLTSKGVSPITPQDYTGIAVVVKETYHIWHYYSNEYEGVVIGWRDDGQDTVSQFTNDIAGIIRGSQSDGFVYAESDGTGSIYGWSQLKTRVTNLETGKADAQDLETEIQNRQDADATLQNNINDLDAAAVKNVVYENNNDSIKAIRKTINNVTSDVVDINTLKSDMALNNVTNDRQVVGLEPTEESGEPVDYNNHIMVFDTDGYHVKDSGKTLEDTGKIDTISINGTDIPAVNKNVDLPPYPTDFYITANATDGLFDITGIGGYNEVTYSFAPYSAKQQTSSFYNGSVNPTLTDRLNYDGYLYATKLYSNGSETITESNISTITNTQIDNLFN